LTRNANLSAMVAVDDAGKPVVADSARLPSSRSLLLLTRGGSAWPSWPIPSPASMPCPPQRWSPGEMETWFGAILWGNGKGPTADMRDVDTQTIAL